MIPSHFINAVASQAEKKGGADDNRKTRQIMEKLTRVAVIQSALFVPQLPMGSGIVGWVRGQRAGLWPSFNLRRRRKHGAHVRGIETHPRHQHPVQQVFVIQAILGRGKYHLGLIERTTHLLFYRAGSSNPPMPISARRRPQMGPNPRAGKQGMFRPQIIGIAPDARRHAAEHGVALLPCPLSGNAIPRHVVEPVDRFLGRPQDLVGVLGHMFGTKEQLEHQDGRGLHQIMGQTPPRRDMVQAHGVGFVRDRIQRPAGRLHADGGGVAVELARRTRRVPKRSIHLAQTGPMDDHLEAVVHQCEAQPLPGEAILARPLGKLEKRGKLGPPLFELTVEQRNDRLNQEPTFVCDARSVQLGKDLMGMHVELRLFHKA